MSSGPKSTTSSGSSSGTSHTKQEQHAKFNEWFIPYWKDLARGAAGALQQVLPAKTFPGPFVAQPLPREYNAAQLISNIGGQALPFYGQAQSLLPGLINAATGAASVAQNPKLLRGANAAIGLGLDQLRGNYLDPNNPVLKGAISSVVSPVMSLANAQINRAMNTASAQGATGNSLAMDPIRLIINQATAQSGDVASRVMNDWMNRERMIMQNSPALIAAGAGLTAMPAGIINNALAGITGGIGGLMQGAGGAATMMGRGGEMERMLNQLGVTNALAQFQESQAAPFRPYFPYAQLLGAIPTLTTDSKGQSTTDYSQQYTGTTTMPQPSPIMGALQGAFGGGSLASSLLPASVLTANPWLPLLGAAGGAAVGGIFR